MLVESMTLGWLEVVVGVLSVEPILGSLAFK